MDMHVVASPPSHVVEMSPRRSSSKTRHELMQMIQEAAVEQASETAPEADDNAIADDNRTSAHAEDALEREVEKHRSIAVALGGQSSPIGREEAMRNDAAVARATSAAAATATAAQAGKEAEVGLQQNDEAEEQDLNAMPTEVDAAGSNAHKHAAAARAEADQILSQIAPNGATSRSASGSGSDLVTQGKAAGNELLEAAAKACTTTDRTGLLERAERAYGSALEADPARKHSHAANVLANRALARLRLAMTLGKWSAPAKLHDAIADATEALALQPKYVKAIYRRARAQLALACTPLAEQGSVAQAEALEGAQADLRTVLELEPSNLEALRWLKAAPRLAAEFGGRHLPETLPELAREMARLDGEILSTSLSPADPRPQQRAAARRRRRDLCALSLLALGAAVLSFTCTGVLPPSAASYEWAATRGLEWASAVKNLSWADVQDASSRASSFGWAQVVQASAAAAVEVDGVKLRLIGARLEPWNRLELWNYTELCLTALRDRLYPVAVAESIEAAPPVRTQDDDMQAQSDGSWQSRLTALRDRLYPVAVAEPIEAAPPVRTQDDDMQAQSDGSWQQSRLTALRDRLYPAGRAATAEKDEQTVMRQKQAQVQAERTVEPSASPVTADADAWPAIAQVVTALWSDACHALLWSAETADLDEEVSEL